MFSYIYHIFTHACTVPSGLSTSVRLSQAGIVLTWLDAPSWFFYMDASFDCVLKKFRYLQK